MAKSTMKLWLRSDKALNDGTAPIYLIYQISGQRKYLNTGIKLFPDNWSKKAQKAVYLDKRTAKRLLPTVDFNILPLAREIEEVNESLAAIISEIKRIEKRLLLDKIQFSPEIIIGRYNEQHIPETKKDQSSSIVPRYIDKYIEEQRNTKTLGSLKVYKSLKNHLVGYALDAKIKISFSAMDKSFFANFQNYLIETKEMRNTTVAKQLSTLKTILNYAESCDLEVNPNYKRFIIKREPLSVIALTQSEFNDIYFYDFSDYTKKIDSIVLLNGKPESISYETLDKVRDLFCFACVTGLRYSDLSHLNHNNVKKTTINITVVKTKLTLTVPLNEYALAILGKYKGMATPLPRMTNQRLNQYLKVICKHIGINDNVEVVRFKGATRIVENYPKYELISVHTGRKTFCTLSLERGMSAEQVMAISGHKDYKSFKRYVNVTNEIKTQAVLKAWKMPEPLKRVK